MTQEQAVPDSARRALDKVDLQILELLRLDARRTVTDIATRVNLSLAPVKRRIDRLEQIGIIRGYTVVIDRGVLQPFVEAYCHIRVTSDGTDELAVWMRDTFPGVQEIAAVAGDDDLIARLRVDGVPQLQRVISTIRAQPCVVSTRTMVVLSTWDQNGTGGAPDNNQV
ncbi:winged helix-turn-helix transcriptional regulator [Nocardia sp. R7R-8]|uniref:winged helix-turn-helix transcriptional regulator n=1 Tax=Nocardia sp. R7R-8 TaxID=3459304 RepID=UPI00403DABAC